MSRVFDLFLWVNAEQTQIVELDPLKYQIKISSSYTDIQMHASIALAEQHEMIHCYKHSQVHVRDDEGGRR